MGRDTAKPEIVLGYGSGAAEHHHADSSGTGFSSINIDFSEIRKIICKPFFGYNDVFIFSDHF